MLLASNPGSLSTKENLGSRLACFFCFFSYRNLCIVLELDTQLAEANKYGPQKIKICMNTSTIIY